MSTTIQEYVVEHTVRGECQCGQCIDRGSRPGPTGHTADLIFFKVAARANPSMEEFIRLAKALKGEYVDVDPFDGQEHNFMELGGWIGDQGRALLFMGLGTILGAFDLLTPNTMLGTLIDDSLKMRMAQGGYVAVKARKAT